jgi:hypothetical protein
MFRAHVSPQNPAKAELFALLSSVSSFRAGIDDDKVSLPFCKGFRHLEKVRLT